MRPSLYPGDSCIFCGSPYTVTHHIFPGSGRRHVSDREGCTCRLCNPHHNMSDHSVHFDKDLDLWLRKDCQARWERREMSESGIGPDEARERFRSTFYESYL